MRRIAFLLVCTISGACYQRDRCEGPLAAGDHTCPMPGWTDRAFDLHVPPGADGTQPLPLVLVLHGGGGAKSNARSMTCGGGGDLDDPNCMTSVADRETFLVAFPNGTGRPLRNLRTWNAGGGEDGWTCVSGPACRANVDDEAYLGEVLDEIARVVPVDPARIYVTGLSNGGAMSHRLGCVMADRFAAIAGVGGGNQYETAAPCPGALPVLQIHGTADRCWPYGGGSQVCSDLLADGDKQSVAATMEGWRVRDGCGATPTETPLPDADPSDGTTTTRVTWPSCTHDVELLRIDGGGHTWPRGHVNLDEAIIGVTSNDFSASEAIWEFFAAHPRAQP